jgi:hypothetical protein
VALIAFVSCAVINSLLSPTCAVNREILSQYSVHPEILHATAIIDFTPSYCYEGLPFLNQRDMQKLIMAVDWDTHFCLGETAILTRFIQDAYGCGDHGGLIVYGPSLQVYVQSNYR